jgi:hypothetical protein
MKRFFLMFMVVLAAIGILAAFGGSKDSGIGIGIDTPKASAPKSGGEVFENHFFKVTLVEGWAVSEADSRIGMMSIYSKSDPSSYAPYIHLRFENFGGFSDTPEQVTAGIANNMGKSGTPAEKEVINGIEYYKTTIVHWGGEIETVMVTRKGRYIIYVRLGGDDYDKNPDIPKMLATLSYNLSYK